MLDRGEEGQSRKCLWPFQRKVAGCDTIGGILARQGINGREARKKYERCLNSSENARDGKRPVWKNLESSEVIKIVKNVQLAKHRAQLGLNFVVGKHLKLVAEHTEGLSFAVHHEQELLQDLNSVVETYMFYTSDSWVFMNNRYVSFTLRKS